MDRLGPHNANVEAIVVPTYFYKLDVMFCLPIVLGIRMNGRCNNLTGVVRGLGKNSGRWRGACDKRQNCWSESKFNQNQNYDTLAEIFPGTFPPCQAMPIVHKGEATTRQMKWNETLSRDGLNGV